MACEFIKVPGGVAVVCSRGGSGSKRCVYCGRPSTKLCDGPAPAGSGRKTCDKNLCDRCAAHVGHDRDLCRTHAAEAAGRPG